MIYNDILYRKFPFLVSIIHPIPSLLQSKIRDYKLSHLLTLSDDLQTTGSRESAGGPQDPPPRTSGPMRDGSDVPVGAVAPLRGARRAGAASRPRSPPPRSARGSPSPVRNRGGASRRSRVITVRAPAATRNPQRASRLRTTMGRQRAGAH